MKRIGFVLIFLFIMCAFIVLNGKNTVHAVKARGTESKINWSKRLDEVNFPDIDTYLAAHEKVYCEDGFSEDSTDLNEEDEYLKALIAEAKARKSEKKEEDKAENKCKEDLEGKSEVAEQVIPKEKDERQEVIVMTKRLIDTDRKIRIDSRLSVEEWANILSEKKQNIDFIVFCDLEHLDEAESLKHVLNGISLRRLEFQGNKLTFTKLNVCIDIVNGIDSLTEVVFKNNNIYDDKLMLNLVKAIMKKGSDLVWRDNKCVRISDENKKKFNDFISKVVDITTYVNLKERTLWVTGDSEEFISYVLLRANVFTDFDKIEVSSCDLSYDLWERFEFILMKNNFIKALRFEGFDFSRFNTKVIVNAIERNPISRVSISDCKFMNVVDLTSAMFKKGCGHHFQGKVFENGRYIDFCVDDYFSILDEIRRGGDEISFRQPKSIWQRALYISFYDVCRELLLANVSLREIGLQDFVIDDVVAQYLILGIAEKEIELKFSGCRVEKSAHECLIEAFDFRALKVSGLSDFSYDFSQYLRSDFQEDKSQKECKEDVSEKDEILEYDMNQKFADIKTYVNLEKKTLWITGDSEEFISYVLLKASEFSGFKEIKVSSCELNCDLWEKFEFILMKNNSIEFLEFEGINFIRFNTKVVANIIERNPINRVSISDCKFVDVVDLASAMFKKGCGHHFQGKVFENGRYIDFCMDDYFSILDEIRRGGDKISFRQPISTRQRALYISFYDVCRELLLANVSLREIGLQDFVIDDVVAQYLILGIAEKEIELKFSSCRVEESACDCLIEAFDFGDFKVSDLSGVMYDFPKCSRVIFEKVIQGECDFSEFLVRKDLYMLLKSICKFKRMTYIHAYIDESIGIDNNKYFEELAELTKTYKDSITKVAIEGSGLIEVDLIKEYIKVYNFEISMELAIYLSDLINQNLVKELKLSGCAIDDDVALYLAKTLKINFLLKLISERNMLSYEGKKILKDYICNPLCCAYEESLLEPDDVLVQSESQTQLCIKDDDWYKQIAKINWKNLENVYICKDLDMVEWDILFSLLKRKSINNLFIIGIKINVNVMNKLRELLVRYPVRSSEGEMLRDIQRNIKISFLSNDIEAEAAELLAKTQVEVSVKKIYCSGNNIISEETARSKAALVRVEKIIGILNSVKKSILCVSEELSIEEWTLLKNLSVHYKDKYDIKVVRISNCTLTKEMVDADGPLRLILVELRIKDVLIDHVRMVGDQHEILKVFSCFCLSFVDRLFLEYSKVTNAGLLGLLFGSRPMTMVVFSLKGNELTDDALKLLELELLSNISTVKVNLLENHFTKLNLLPFKIRILARQLCETPEIYNEEKRELTLKDYLVDTYELRKVLELVFRIKWVEVLNFKTSDVDTDIILSSLIEFATYNSLPYWKFTVRVNNREYRCDPKGKKKIKLFIEDLQRSLKYRSENRALSVAKESISGKTNAERRVKEVDLPASVSAIIVSTMEEVYRETGRFYLSRIFGSLESKDPYVSKLAEAINIKSLGGRSLCVNTLVYRSDGSMFTDLDIELDTIVIQVKSGKALHNLLKQCQKSFEVTGKCVISYTPEVAYDHYVLQIVRREGFDTFINQDELLKYLDTH